MNNEEKQVFADIIGFDNDRHDLLEPEMYPDPLLFRASLARITEDELELKKNISSNKATIRVLAPYLKIIHKDRQRILKSAIKRTPALVRIQKQLHERKIGSPITDMFPDLTAKSEMVSSINETADILRAVLAANNVVSYLVNPTEGKLFQIPRHVTSLAYNLTWKIEKGTTIAAYAAFTESYVTSKHVSLDERFPLGLGYVTSTVLYAMCVPIKTPDNKVVGVYELTRTVFEQAFTNKDLQTVLAVTGWMGVAILQNGLYTSLLRQHELTDYLLQLTDHYHSGHADHDKTLSDVAVFARDTADAERCSLFIVEEEKRRVLIVNEYEQGAEDDDRLLYKRRVKRNVTRDTSILGRVLFGKETVSRNRYAVADVDQSWNSVLCAPIVSSGKVVGAIQLMNKRLGNKFNEEDKETLETFTKFCSINISHLNAQEKIKRCELKLDVSKELLFHHIKPCLHDQAKVSESWRAMEDLPEGFFTFSWYPTPNHIPKLAEITIKMFQEVIGDSFMSLNNVPRFVLTVQNCYRPNPYHNYMHALSVAHAMANMIRRNHQIFTGIERKGLMIAALCHDLDHRGYTNNFIQLSKHYLSSLYETSCLENHHFAVTKLIMEQCGICKYFKPAIYNQLLKHIYELIIATDLSLYFQNRMELMKTADDETFTFHNLSHRRLIQSIMMTACDLVGQTKPFPISKKITEDVYEEFYEQGDVEKKMGFVPLPMMNREHKDMMADNQVQFLSIVVIPCVELVSRFFTSLSPVVWDTKCLLAQWKELIEVRDQDTWKPGDSIVSEDNISTT